MSKACFVSDLHGSPRRYEALFRYLSDNPPDILFIGGDLFPGALRSLFNVTPGEAFVEQVILANLRRLRRRLGGRYPEIFVILGNDDGRFWEASVLDVAAEGYWHYLHNRHVVWRDFDLYGYNYVPPTPFRLKDWERYDVSRYIDPGCIAPAEGVLTMPVSEYELDWATIEDDLQRLIDGKDLERAIMLFHTPPYQSDLDRAALDGKTVDHVPLDVHVGSIAVKRLIEEHQPLLTLHGHVHEASTLTGSFCQGFGRTFSINGAYDGPELALIEIPLSEPEKAQRLLL